MLARKDTMPVRRIHQWQLSVIGLGLVIVGGAGLSVVRHAQATVVRHSPFVNVPPAGAIIDPLTRRLFIATPSGVAGSNGVVITFRSDTLARLRTTFVGYDPSAMVVDVAARRVFVANRATLDASGSPRGKGSVSILDARTGALLKSTVVGMTPRALALDDKTGRVFVANYDDGTVSMLDALHGTIVRTEPVGRHPSAITVDVSTHRAFVVSTDGTMQVLDTRSGVKLRSISSV